MTRTCPPGIAWLDVGRDALVTDIDSADFAGGSLTVAIIVNKAAGEDQLVLDTASNGVTMVGNEIFVDAISVGTISADGVGLDRVITFNSGATAALVSRLIQNFSYFNTNQATPSTAQRLVEFRLADGDGGTMFAHTTVAVAAVNDAAILSADVRNLTETNSATDISSSGTLTISDVDSPATFVAQAGTAGSLRHVRDRCGGRLDLHRLLRPRRVRRWNGLHRHVHGRLVGRHHHVGDDQHHRHQRRGDPVVGRPQPDRDQFGDRHQLVGDADDQRRRQPGDVRRAGRHGGQPTARSRSMRRAPGPTPPPPPTTSSSTAWSTPTRFTVASSDGTTTSVTINITGTNDAAILSSDVRNLTETNSATDISSSGTLTISDVDSPATFVAQAGTAGTYGTFAIDAAGAWTYTASSAHDEFADGVVYTDSFAVVSADGTATSVTINITGTNDAAILSADVRNLTETNCGDRHQLVGDADDQRRRQPGDVRRAGRHGGHLRHVRDRCGGRLDLHRFLRPRRVRRRGGLHRHASRSPRRTAPPHR